MPKSKELLGASIPYVEASNVGSKQRPTAIVLRTSFTTSDAGAALGIALAWNHPNNIDSCHYVVDEFKVFRCIDDKIESKSIATDRFNRRGITINLCYDPAIPPSDRLIHRTAKQVARLCRLHRIKVRILNADQENQWVNHPWHRRGGIVLATVGEFPTNKFLDHVDQEYRNYDFKDYYGTV